MYWFFHITVFARASRMKMGEICLNTLKMNFLHRSCVMNFSITKFRCFYFYSQKLSAWWKKHKCRLIFIFLDLSTSIFYYWKLWFLILKRDVTAWKMIFRFFKRATSYWMNGLNWKFWKFWWSQRGCPRIGEFARTPILKKFSSRSQIFEVFSLFFMQICQIYLCQGLFYTILYIDKQFCKNLRSFSKWISVEFR